ncbi:MAG: GtrA family protein [Rhodovarius sp.]|nr:GtrA family protein [Rhodovarius sp.]MCX7931059.1 GtrA family protein [Rhodovarius sp.]MDW8314821.1 GtrA family protein [Rhodovarius sp.]
MPQLMGQFLRFGVVGTLGFLVDAGVLMVMLWLGLGPYWGRVVSYIAAASGNWAMNRAWTFRDRGAGQPMGRQWAMFLLLNLLGFAANYGTYAALVTFEPTVARWPVLGVAAGAIAGMLINFAIARQVIFRPRQGGRGPVTG